MIDARMLTCPITGIQFEVVQIGHLLLDTHVITPITRQIGAHRTNQKQEFCYSYDYI